MADNNGKDNGKDKLAGMTVGPEGIPGPTTTFPPRPGAVGQILQRAKTKVYNKAVDQAAKKLETLYDQRTKMRKAFKNLEREIKDLELEIIQDEEDGVYG